MILQKPASEFNILPFKTTRANRSPNSVTLHISVTTSGWHYTATSGNRIVASDGDSFTHARALYVQSSPRARIQFALIRAQAKCSEMNLRIAHIETINQECEKAG